MKKKIALIADDSEMNSALLSEMLSAFDIDSEIVENGQEAFELAKNNLYDIVFMDHMMPVMDGIDALKAIREAGILNGIPIIMMTANDESNDIENYFSVGFTDYMKKPFSVKKIGELLEKYNLKKSVVEDKDDWEELSGKLTFLEVGSVGEYFMNDASFYIQVLHEYVKSDILVRLKHTIETDDKEGVRALIRCIGEEARLIGAKSMAETASNAEIRLMQGQDEDFYESYKKLISAQKRLFKRVATAIS